MRKNRSIFFCILIFASLIIFAEQKNSEYCEIDQREPVGAAWKKCEGKRVRITGRISNFVSQHPTGMHDVFDPEANDVKRKYETYIDTGTSQIVITSDEKIECSGDIEVEGIVDIVDLGGAEGTKTSYKNVWIQVQNYRCK